MTAERRRLLRERCLASDRWERSEATEDLLRAGERSFSFWSSIAEDSDELVRYDAACAFFHIHHSRTVRLLHDWFEREVSATVRRNLWLSLAIHDPQWVKEQDVDAIHWEEQHGLMAARCWIGDPRGPRDCYEILRNYQACDSTLGPFAAWFDRIEHYSPWGRPYGPLPPTRYINAVARLRPRYPEIERFFDWLLGGINRPKDSPYA